MYNVPTVPLWLVSPPSGFVMSGSTLPAPAVSGSSVYTASSSSAWRAALPRFESRAQLQAEPQWLRYLDAVYGAETLDFPLDLQRFHFFYYNLLHVRPPSRPVLSTSLEMENDTSKAIATARKAQTNVYIQRGRSDLDIYLMWASCSIGVGSGCGRATVWVYPRRNASIFRSRGTSVSVDGVADHSRIEVYHCANVFDGHVFWMYLATGSGIFYDVGVSYRSTAVDSPKHTLLTSALGYKSIHGAYSRLPTTHRHQTEAFALLRSRGYDSVQFPSTLEHNMHKYEIVDLRPMDAYLKVALANHSLSTPDYLARVGHLSGVPGGNACPATQVARHYWSGWRGTEPCECQQTNRSCLNCGGADAGAEPSVEIVQPPRRPIPSRSASGESPQIVGGETCSATVASSNLLDAAKMAKMVASSNLSSLQRRNYAGLVRSLRPKKSRHVQAVVIGGSVTKGTGCFDSKHSEEECAYPARFARWMRCHPAIGTNLGLANRARSGTTTAAALPLLPAMVRMYGDDGDAFIADWLIVDFSSNDAHFSHFYRPPSRQRRLEEQSSGTISDPVVAATEVMLRYLIEEHPQLPLLLVESDCHSKTSRIAHQMVAEHYGVPFVAYSEALREGEGCSRNAWRFSEHSKVHPTWHTHDVVAQMLALWWEAFTPSLRAGQKEESPPSVNERAFGPHLTSSAARAQFAICRRPITVYDAHEASKANVQSMVVTSDGWELYEDRPKKPGWITSGPVGASINFNLTFGAAPRLVLLYEAGYEGWGDVHLHIGARTTPRGANYILVQGLRTGGDKVTQAELLTLEVGTDSEGGRNNHAIKPFSTASLKVVFVSKPPLRFKLLHVSSC